jgi:hypothetical protein
VLVRRADDERRRSVPRQPQRSIGRVAPAPSTVKGAGEGRDPLRRPGTCHVKVTASPAAQAWFDQGLRLTYGFNHDEATRSFARGAELDPGCAMCFWGAALTMGPNYTVPMRPDRARAAWDALVSARAAAPRTTAVEQSRIGALANRYKGPEPLEPPALQPFNAGDNVARDVFAVAAKVLEARIATENARKAGKPADALGAWQEAVLLSDRLAYSEPDDWFYPFATTRVRRSSPRPRPRMRRRRTAKICAGTPRMAGRSSASGSRSRSRTAARRRAR